MSDWPGYFDQWVPRPSGPFRLVEGAEYKQALREKKRSNKAAQNADPSLKGKHIHEIHPVKFGGSPTDPANKIALEKERHVPITGWWNKLMYMVQKQQ